MGVIHVERIDPEAAPAPGGLPGKDRFGGSEGQELGRHDEAGAFVRRHLRERGADDPLRAPGAVRLGGVDHRDPELHRAAQERRSDLGRIRLTVAPLARAELPGAQPDPGDAKICYLDVLHRASLAT